ncbi:MAG: hypothetical protein KAJ01_02735, partial [Candidatus Hydrogenedentes bacterium]|nr:hypothetical protein [Candidatus Hydrogenedentota bacterium]
DALRAVNPIDTQSWAWINPAVWIPLLTAAATALVVWCWLKKPRRRWGLLVLLLLADLFFVTRFVDVFGKGAIAPNPEISPAAEWLKANAPEVQTYRIWGLGDPYARRQPELLLARTNTVHGLATISTYGPFQSPAHAQLFGFRIFGTNRNWEWVIRSNHLLRRYAVRYLIAEKDSRFAKVIESVRTPAEAPPLDAPGLLGGEWKLSNAKQGTDALRLCTPVMWWLSQAEQNVTISSNRTYRISLEARAPDGGAANFLQAEVFRKLPDGQSRRSEETFLIVYPEQLGGDDWRRFEWVFRAPPQAEGQATFRVLTMSERPIEVRNISLREGARARFVASPTVLSNLGVGERIYRKVAELQAVDPTEAPVVIYENLPVERIAPFTPPDNRTIEAVKWKNQPGRPDVGIRPKMRYTTSEMLMVTTLPGCILWAVVAVGLGILRFRRK